MGRLLPLHISHLVLMFLSLTLNIHLSTGIIPTTLTTVKTHPPEERATARGTNIIFISFVFCLQVFLWKKTIDIAVPYFLNKTLVLNSMNLSYYIKINTNVLQDGKFCHQIDCMAMGLPLCPVLSNLLGNGENLWLPSFTQGEMNK